MNVKFDFQGFYYEYFGKMNVKFDFQAFYYKYSDTLSWRALFVGFLI